MKKKKVSIIIPVYNSEKTLEKCIDSVRDQTYKNIEILIINDGSQDNSLSIMNKYKNKDKRIIIINQENKGLSGARNTGIKNATGDYITFIDSDDYINETMIEECMNIFIKYNCDAIRNNYIYDYPNGNKSLNKDEINKEQLINLKDENQKESLVKKILMGKIQSYSWLLIIKRKIFTEKHLQFDEDILFMEDIIFLNRLLLSIDSIFLMGKPNYYYYQNKEGMTKNYSNYIKNMNNILIMNQRLNEILSLYKERAYYYIEITNAMYINGIIGYLKDIIINNQEYSKIEIELKKIREKDIMKYMLKNKNTKILKIHYRIYIFLYRLRMYNLLILMFKIEKFLKNNKKEKL